MQTYKLTCSFDDGRGQWGTCGRFFLHVASPRARGCFAKIASVTNDKSGISSRAAALQSGRGRYRA